MKSVILREVVGFGIELLADRLKLNPKGMC